MLSQAYSYLIVHMEKDVRKGWDYMCHNVFNIVCSYNILLKIGSSQTLPCDFGCFPLLFGNILWISFKPINTVYNIFLVPQSNSVPGTRPSETVITTIKNNLHWDHLCGLKLHVILDYSFRKISYIWNCWIKGLMSFWNFSTSHYLKTLYWHPGK